VIKIVLSIIFYLTFTYLVAAEIIKDIQVIGEYYYGPNISDNQACEYAKEKAKNNALRKVVEEAVVTSTRENCSDVNDKKECSFFEDTWSFLGEGFLKDSNFTNRNIDKDSLGKFCRVNLKTDIIKPGTQSDPSYNLNAYLKPNKIFRHGSTNFKIKGEVSQKSFIHILGWYPQEDKNNYHCLTSYFNDYKTPIKNIEFPPPGRQVKIIFPSNINQDFVNQYLILVALKENITLPCFQKDRSIKIKKEKLFNFLSRIERENWTKEMLIYKIIK